MSNLNTILNKLGKIEAIHETNLGKHEVELALLDELSNLNMEGGSLLVLQAQQSEAFTKLEKSISINKKGLDIAQRGLKAAQDLGEPKTIEIFKNWVKTFSSDIQRAEKGKKLISQLSNI